MTGQKEEKKKKEKEKKEEKKGGEGEKGKLSWMGRDIVEGSVLKRQVIWYDKSEAGQRGWNNNCTAIANKMKIRQVVGYKYLHIKKGMTALW